MPESYFIALIATLVLKNLTRWIAVVDGLNTNPDFPRVIHGTISILLGGRGLQCLICSTEVKSCALSTPYKARVVFQWYYCAYLLVCIIGIMGLRTASPHGKARICNFGEDNNVWALFHELLTVNFGS